MTIPSQAWISSGEEPLLAEHLVKRVCGRAAGTFESECTHDFPHDKYFIGCLRPAPPIGAPPPPQQPGFMDELLTKLAPMAFGAAFRLRAGAAGMQLMVQLAWNCYYRVFPTLAEQREYQRYVVPAPADASATQTAEPGSEAEDPFDAGAEEADEGSAQVAPIITPPAAPPRRTRQMSDSLFPKFRKIQCVADGIVNIARSVNGDAHWSVEGASLRASIERELARAINIVIADQEAIRIGTDPDARIRVPATALDSTEAYAAYCNGMPTLVIPQWAWRLALDVRSSGSSNEVEFTLEATNGSRCDPRSWHSEGFFFDVKAVFSFAPGDVRPFELELAPRGFRYDRHLWGQGFNCGVNETSSDASHTVFETTNAPVHEQQRYTTNTEPAAPFSDLAERPGVVLRGLLAAMRSYNSEWTAQRTRYVEADPAWAASHGEEFDRDFQNFREEADRLERGLQLIEGDPDVLLAFQLMNRAFAAGGHKTSWRLFQIVFLVSQIPGIHALKSRDAAGTADRSVVDIVYFPTGGGKTEAYLGVIVFHCFFDRLRGKAGGVTTWTRFPLRLLTLQQTQRVADVMGAAELIRRSHTDPRLSGRDVDGFAVGYFVGQEATPNDLSPPRRGEPPEPNWSFANDPIERQRWKKIMRCPSCHTANVTIDFDPLEVRLRHRCMTNGCRFPGGYLPVYVVDNEVYRYLPCVLVGTIDKLAGLGNQRKLSMVLGDVTGKCTVHGYYSAKCCQKECTDARRLRPGAPAGLSGPTLFVQDELHLLKEGLGTFDAHYETFLQRLLRERGNAAPPKIIASSATIEAFERQVEHLYGRTARVFPGQGPTLAASFYACTQSHPQRLFVGILPHNKTIFNAVLEMLQYYHEEVDALTRLSLGTASPFGGRVVPGSSEWAALLDPYVTTLGYFSAARDLNSVRTDLESHTNTELERLGIRPLRLAELSGSTTTDVVTGVLDALENARPGDGSAPNVVLATSMISHGVDVNRFNCMLFYGMPKQNAEYIQSSSRVGRAHVGLVFVCLKPARERDQSHFAYFKKYHQFLGQLVEPVAINRWSKFSVERTIPGLFMGVLLQQIANRSGQPNPNRYYMADFVKSQISQGLLRPETFIEILEDAYLVSRARGPGPTAFREQIGLRVRQFMDQILGSGGHVSFVSEALVPKPMRSLRDVDEQISIELDSSGTDWARRSSS